jgi:hypothetical protein
VKDYELVTVWDGRKDAPGRGHLTLQPDELREAPKVLTRDTPEYAVRYSDLRQQLRQRLELGKCTSADLTALGIKPSSLPQMLAELRKSGDLKEEPIPEANARRREPLRKYWI